MRRLLSLSLLLVVACDPELVRRCLSDKDCQPPARCGAEGFCVTPSGLADGAPCVASDQCQSRLCFDAGKGAVCSRPCDEPARCAAGQVCVPVPGKAPPAASPELLLICAATGAGTRYLGESCDEDASCRSGLCEASRCAQPCGTCPGLMVCEKTSLSRGSLSVEASICKTRLLETLDLGQATVTAAGPSSLSLPLPSGVDSFLLYADDTEELRIALSRVEAPDGAVLVDYAAPDAALMRAWDYLGTASAQVPGTDSAKARVQTGTYKLEVRTYEKNLETLTPAAGTIERVAAVWRRSRQKGGLLDLDLHFAPATGITAATAPTSVYLGEALAELQRLYRGLLGVGLGEVRYFDLTAADDTVASADAARAIRKKSAKAGPHGLSVSVFVVKSITYGFDAVSGGIPGVPGLAGRPSCGIVAEAPSTSKNLGRLLAHEIAHYLGLFHTTEAGAKVVDKIADTPSCPAGTQVASCPDKQNLMFPWYLTTAEPPTLSAGQASVLRGSPFLYELVYPEACGPGVEVVDVSAQGFASGTTDGASSTLSASCGGAGAGERVHLYRLKSAGLKSLEIEVLAKGFEPVLYALKGECAPGSQAIACQAGAAGTAVKITLASPEPEAYFFVVDGKSAGGTYTLTVRPSS